VYTKNIPIVSGIPDKLNLKMKYNEIITLTNLTANYYQFRINSLQDPNYSGVGHQPRSYDQWGAFYGRYKVNGCKVQVRCFNGSTSSLKTFMHADTDPSQIMSYEEAIEGPAGNTNLIVPAANQSSIPSMNRYYSIRKVCGEKTLDDIYSSPFGANPTKQVYLTIGAESLTTGLLATSISFDVTLTFYVSLFDRIQLPQS